MSFSFGFSVTHTGVHLKYWHCLIVNFNTIINL